MTPIYDNHNHCQFSFDVENTTVEASARAAAAAGLAGLCFTDHCDFYVPEKKAETDRRDKEEFDVPERDAEIDRVNALAASGDIRPKDTGFGREEIPFKVFKGIEIGVQRSMRDKIASQLETYSFDEVIASLHYLDDTDPYGGGYYMGKDWRTAYGHYLETLYEELVWLGDRFDIMGHYDYVTRYAPYPECSILYRDFPDLLDEILRFLAENGKALEYNSKTYVELNGRTPEPDRNIYLRFRELGGEFVSLGSDSHDAGRVGAGFGRAVEFVKSCGFRHLVHFEGRKPVML